VKSAGAPPSDGSHGTPCRSLVSY